MFQILLGMIVCVLIIIAYRSPMFGLILVIACTSNFFGLVNMEMINKGGESNINDVALLFVMIMVFKIFTTNDKYMLFTTKSTFNRYILAFFLILICETFVSYKLYEQPIVLSLRAARHYMLFLLYYPFSVYLSEENHRQTFIKILTNTAVLLALLYSIQFVLSDKITFLYAPISERYGGTRIHVSGFGLIITGFIFTLDSLLHKRKVFSKEKFFVWIKFISLAFIIIFVSRSRANLFGISTLFVLILLFSKQINVFKKISTFSFSLFTITLLILFNVFAPIIHQLNVDMNNKSSISVRLLAINFYSKYYMESPFFGLGIPNILYFRNPFTIGYAKGYYLVDLGIYGFTFVFGIMGLVWLFLTLKKWFVNVRQIPSDNEYKYIIIGFMIYYLAIFPSINPFTDQSYRIYFILLLALTTGILIEGQKGCTKLVES